MTSGTAPTGPDGAAQGASDTAEIYEPPYLFKGARPTIGLAPSNIKVGSGFGVQTPDANVSRAVLVAPGSATHAVDMNQRLIPLSLTKRTGCVDLDAPPNVNAAPPGWYMLFLLNDKGVPSVAKFVRLRPDGDKPDDCAEHARSAQAPGSARPAGSARTPRIRRTRPNPPKPPKPPKPPVDPPNLTPAISRLKVGSTKIGLRLSEAAKIRISFDRRRPSRGAVGARWVKLKTTITVNGRSGTNTISFNPRRRGFPAGSYRLIVRATDRTGKRSTPASARFSVKARSRARAGSASFAGAFGALDRAPALDLTVQDFSPRSEARMAWARCSAASARRMAC